ncbi:hypothetical protein DFH29DRAFT_934763 [Suillus ampliporus]|nr:hypothetical protein DFH29DRAFT_934763 [Suillus ampliporus]
MDPPMSRTTFRISTPLGPASQFANSNVVMLKGRTNREKGELYLQLSLTALQELAALLENNSLSADDKTTYHVAYTAGKRQREEVKKIREQLLAQKKSFRKFLVNLFVRDSDARRFYKFSYDNYSSIRRTSDDLNTLLLPDMDAIPTTSGSSGESAQGDASVSEESPRDVVEVEDLSPNETVRGITLDVPTEQAQETFAILNRLKNSISGEEDEDDDDQTIRPSTSESRPPSPTPSCTIIHNNYYINQSVVSFDSEMTGTTINSGVNEGIGAASLTDSDTNKPPSPWD